MIWTITRSITERHHEHTMYQVTVSPCVSQIEIMELLSSIIIRKIVTRTKIEIALSVDQL